MGELFNSPHEWTPLIAERLIDYIRVHVSRGGDFTPARKIGMLAETYGVKAAWHGPSDVSPAGHMANVTLDLAPASHQGAWQAGFRVVELLGARAKDAALGAGRTFSFDCGVPRQWAQLIGSEGRAASES